MASNDLASSCVLDAFHSLIEKSERVRVIRFFQHPNFSRAQLSLPFLQIKRKRVGGPTSGQTASSVLAKEDIRSRWAAPKPILKPENERQRLDFAQRCCSWIGDQWARVLSTDEASVRRGRSLHHALFIINCPWHEQEGIVDCAFSV